MSGAALPAGGTVQPDELDELWCVEGLPIPPSQNNMFPSIGKRGRIKSEKYKAWEQMAGYAINRLKPPRTIAGRISLHYIFGEHGTRADLGNLEKATTDLLVALRVIVADDKVHVRRILLDWGDGDSLKIVIRRHE